MEIDDTFAELEKAVKPFPKAAMFALADEGFISPFEQLLASILSLCSFDLASISVLVVVLIARSVR